MNTPSSMRRVKRLHFIGIGGAGMCGIAEVLLNQGYAVSGSDVAGSPTTARLEKLGATVFIGHQASHIAGADVVVVSSAIFPANPELVAAKEQHIPILARAQMLAELMRTRYGIAVAGSHGKTTVTSLIAHIFTQAGQDPTFVIGGRLNSANSHAKLGESHYFIAEADESDASFLHLFPTIAVVTNISADHLGTYGGDFNQLKKTFVRFTQNLPFYGLAVLCIDNAAVCEVRDQVSCPYITYGFDPSAHVRAEKYKQVGPSSEFIVHYNLPTSGKSGAFPINIPLPGRHNAENVLAAAAVALEEGLAPEAIQKALANFSGVARRFHVDQCVLDKEKTVTLIDDYGHHPHEILSTIQAVREGWPDTRLVMLFQPHRYTRTRDCFDEFVQVLSQVDVLLMLPVYPASEAPIAGAHTQDLCRSIRQRGDVDPIYVEHSEALAQVEKYLQKGDVFIAQGAGSVGLLAEEFRAKYR